MFLIYGALLLGLYAFQKKLLFHPSKLPQDYQYQFKHEFDELFFDTPDEGRINALHFKNPAPYGIIVYYHGNAGHLARWGEIIQPILKFNYDIIIMNYRGFGKSTGPLSEANIHGDAQVLYDYAKKYIGERKVIVYGRSMGTGFATQIAANNPCDALILETPYYSVLNLSQSLYPFMPVKRLLKYPLRSDLFIEKVDCPVQIFHGTKDRVIPLQQAEKLNGLLIGNKNNFTILKGAGHSNIGSYDAYWKQLEKFLEEC